MPELWTPGGADNGGGLILPPGTEPSKKPAPHPGSPESLEQEVLADVYDHELLLLEEALTAVREKYEYLPGTEENLSNMVNEMVARAAEAGFEINVTFDYSELMGVLVREPQFVLVGRIEKGHDFDRERQTWEVQNNLLEIDDNPGAMKADGRIKSPSTSISLSGASKD